jgi:WD40 repeat protein
MQCLRHDSEILNVCFSPNGSRLAAGQCDDLISVWNMESTIKEAVLPGRLLSFAPDGQVLATVGREGFVKLQRI